MSPCVRNLLVPGGLAAALALCGCAPARAPAPTTAPEGWDDPANPSRLLSERGFEPAGPTFGPAAPSETDVTKSPGATPR